MILNTNLRQNYTDVLLIDHMKALNTGLLQVPKLKRTYRGNI